MFDYEDQDDYYEEMIFLEDEEIDYYEFGDQGSEENKSERIMNFVSIFLFFLFFVILALSCIGSV